MNSFFKLWHISIESKHFLKSNSKSISIMIMRRSSKTLKPRLDHIFVFSNNKNYKLNPLCKRQKKSLKKRILLQNLNKIRQNLQNKSSSRSKNYKQVHQQRLYIKKPLLLSKGSANLSLINHKKVYKTPLTKLTLRHQSKFATPKKITQFPKVEDNFQLRERLVKLEPMKIFKPKPLETERLRDTIMEKRHRVQKSEKFTESQQQSLSTDKLKNKYKGPIRGSPLLKPEQTQQSSQSFDHVGKNLMALKRQQTNSRLQYTQSSQLLKFLQKK